MTTATAISIPWVALQPRERIGLLEWAKANVSMPNGVPYDHDAYPHLGAPGGPCEAFDDPEVTDIVLQFGSRLGKTAFGLCCMLKLASTNPCPMMFASATEKLAVEVIGTKFYPMLEKCKLTRPQLRPPTKRKRDRVDLDACRVFVAWARSPSTLADKAVKFGHGNEIDKWEHESTSKEGDPAKLFAERGKEFPSRKFLWESTPTIKGRSRVESELLRSSNARFLVPCPLCGHFQRLRLGHGSAGGLIWDHDSSGRSNADLAWRTARYICERCEGELHDEHRGIMCRAGKWLHEGQSIDDAGTITGERRVKRRAGFQLSSLYALSLGWGDIAQEFVSSKPKPVLLQNFVNGWLGETWELHKSKTLPEQLGERLTVPESKRGIMPAWSTFITIGVDKQQAEGGTYPFVVLAHGPDERCEPIEWGKAHADSELRGEVIERLWPHADGGHPVRSLLALMDSGFDTKAVYDFCRGRRDAQPLKGLDSSSSGEPYGKSLVDYKGPKPKSIRVVGTPLLVLVLCNTDYWETELQAMLDDRNPGDPGSMSFCAEAGQDMDFCEQLLNGVKGDKINARGDAKLLWILKDEQKPNDYRDALRYAKLAAKIVLDDRGGRLPLRNPPPAVAAKPKARLTMPDGRPYFIGER